MPEPAGSGGRAARRDQAGSTLLLVPSAVLVLFLLTALAIDGAASFLAQRELADACAGAANDAATVAVAPDRLYDSGPSGPVVDLDRAVAIAQSRTAPLAARWNHPVTARADVDGPEVVLSLQARAPLPIGPGGAGRARVAITATCRSTSVRG